MNYDDEIESIKRRNKSVETDKAWEVSWTRCIFIMLVTYIIAGVWLLTINDTDPWLKAFVPTGGYLLSTLSLPFVRKCWEYYHN